MNEKLSVMELLKRAAKLLFSNISLASFLFLCSLPLFCFLIFFELSLQTTISLTYQFLSQELDLGRYFFLQDQKDLSENDLIPWLIQTSLLYFLPYTLLNLFTTTMIVAASSAAYTSEEEPLGMLCLVPEIRQDMPEQISRLSDHVSLCPPLVNLRVLRLLLRFSQLLIGCFSLT